MNTSHTRRGLINAAAAVISEAAIKVPQKFIDHARRVGSTPLFAELSYRNWSKRGLTDQQILDLITKHGAEQKKHEAVIDEETKTYRIFARFNNKNAKGIWQKINWSTEAASKEEAEAKFRKRMGKDLIKDLEITESTLEEGKNLKKWTDFNVDKIAKDMMRDNPVKEYDIDDLVGWLNVFGWEHKLEDEMDAGMMCDLSKILISKGYKKATEKALCNESVIEEAFTPEARKAIQLVTNLDAVDMEQFLQGFALYLDNSVVDDGDDFDKLGKIINKARQTWKARKGN